MRLDSEIGTLTWEVVRAQAVKRHQRLMGCSDPAFSDSEWSTASRVRATPNRGTASIRTCSVGCRSTVGSDVGRGHHLEVDPVVWTASGAEEVQVVSVLVEKMKGVGLWESRLRDFHMSTPRARQHLDRAPASATAGTAPYTSAGVRYFSAWCGRSSL